ncbi:MAG: amidase [Gemmatimonadetes bacterium]|nr:amidase [Gemmatimonadota bacterium]
MATIRPRPFRPPHRASLRPRIRSTTTVLTLVALAGCQPAFVVEETTIGDVHEAMAAGRLTAVDLVQAYLDRIDAYDKAGPYINSLIRVNEAALDRARELDSIYAVRGPVGPLHGIPIIVKDNYDTFDLPTTNGILALKHSVPPDDAYQIRRVREAGAIILAKANLAEFATSGAYTVSSVLPGFSRNPYDTKRVTAGSSGGTAAAVAANFGTVGLGTDTGSSIRGPSSHQALVGFRLTQGLASRDGIAPLNSARDVGGPMARTVEDAVVVLEVMVGYDPADSVTRASDGRIPESYAASLDSAGLRGARIGVLRSFFEVADAEETGPEPTPFVRDTTESQQQEDDPPEPRKVHPEVLRLMEQALADMAAAGATIVDSVDIPHMDSLRRAIPSVPRFRHDFDAYMAQRPDAPVQSMQDVLDSGDFHPRLRTNLTRAVEVEGPPEEHENWSAYWEATRALQDAVLAAMDSADVDVLVYPTYNYPARLIGDENTTYGANSGTLSPPTGFPAFNVPMGYSFGTLPAGLQLLGRPFDEPTLIRISYAYEQATLHRRPPPSTPPLARR